MLTFRVQVSEIFVGNLSKKIVVAFFGIELEARQMWLPSRKFLLTTVPTSALSTRRWIPAKARPWSNLIIWSEWIQLWILGSHQTSLPRPRNSRAELLLYTQSKFRDGQIFGNRKYQISIRRKGKGRKDMFLVISRIPKIYAIIIN